MRMNAIDAFSSGAENMDVPAPTANCNLKIAFRVEESCPKTFIILTLDIENCLFKLLLSEEIPLLEAALLAILGDRDTL